MVGVYLIISSNTVGYYGDDSYVEISMARWLVYNQGLTKNAPYRWLDSYFPISEPKGIAFFISYFYLYNFNLSIKTITIISSLGSLFILVLSLYALTYRIIKNKLYSSLSMVLILMNTGMLYYILHMKAIKSALGYAFIPLMILIVYGNAYKTKINIGLSFVFVGMYMMHSPDVLLFSCGSVLYLIFTSINKIIFEKKPLFNKRQLTYDFFIRSIINLPRMVIYFMALLFLTKTSLTVLGILKPLNAEAIIVFMQQFPLKLLSPKYTDLIEYCGGYLWYISILGIFVYLFKTPKKSKTASFLMYFILSLLFISFNLPAWFTSTGINRSTGIGWPFKYYFSYLGIPLSIFSVMYIQYAIDHLMLNVSNNYKSRLNNSIVVKLGTILLIVLTVNSFFYSATSSISETRYYMMDKPKELRDAYFDALHTLKVEYNFNTYVVIDDFHPYAYSILPSMLIAELSAPDLNLINVSYYGGRDTRKIIDHTITINKENTVDDFNNHLMLNNIGYILFNSKKYVNLSSNLEYLSNAQIIYERSYTHNNELNNLVLYKLSYLNMSDINQSMKWKYSVGHTYEKLVEDSFILTNIDVESITDRDYAYSSLYVTNPQNNHTGFIMFKFQSGLFFSSGYVDFATNGIDLDTIQDRELDVYIMSADEKVLLWNDDAYKKNRHIDQEPIDISEYINRQKSFSILIMIQADINNFYSPQIYDLIINGEALN